MDKPSLADQLATALGSPLRLRLVAQFLDASGEALSLEEAAVRTACPQEDVAACLRPLVSWGVLEEMEGGSAWRLRKGLPAELAATIRRAVRGRSDDLERERRVRHELLGGLIGGDPKMQLVTEMVRKVARLDVPVLITGETGTGKELVARALHDLSRRSGAFFGDVNCATLTETLFESHVFGHARGAFTGAMRAHAGFVERCDGGTLFLDEIGELSPENQAKLLRVLQTRTYTRLGETTPRSSDFRLVSATNRELATMVREGRFREDLFYRLNVFPIRVPALRERLDDLPYLVEEIVARNAGRLGRAPKSPAFTAAALQRLRESAWPGNIRELENVVVRGMIAAGGARVDVPHLPPAAAQPSPPTPAPGARGLRSLADVEREHVMHVLEALGGNMTSAAEVLGVSRATLYRKMREYGVAMERTARPTRRG
ncbi:MAG TPA: sigma-54 dependent transcriptional regulator [Polyangia bacterium]|jgi:DNA-binding NtrC family response regulator|nr:sigma-54 dependent transcriptional regulator [Polyangia bacterium]